MDIILYHKGCPDGFVSAYIAHRKYPEALLVPYDQGQAPPHDIILGKDVLSVDLRWKDREAVETAQKIAKSFRVIDHHASGNGDLSGLPDYIFDVKRSGAGLTWDYLFGKDKHIDYNDYITYNPFYEPRPWWVNYIEDRDLWTWKLPHSKSISAYFTMLPLEVEAWNTLTSMVPTLDTDRLSEIVGLGDAILGAEERYVNETTRNVAYGVLVGEPVAILNAPYMHASELGAKLCHMNPDVHASVTYYEKLAEGRMHFSLRGDGTVNVGAICKKFEGGGGHHNAGGFTLPLQEGRSLIVAIMGDTDATSCGTTCKTCA